MPSPLLLRNPTVARPPPRSSTTTHASYGGYRSGGFPGDERGRQGPPFGRGGGGGGLILPGRESYDPDTDSRSRLFVPGDDGARSGPLGGGGVEGERSIQNFRPPQGFMDRDPDAEQNNDINAPPEVMLQRLRGRMGKWYDLARLLPALHSQGYDSSAVEETTGLEKRLQGVWQAALPVHDSLRQSHALSDDQLAHFDFDGEHLLYEIRMLTAQQRADVAAYIVQRRLTPPQAQMLSRAVKEYERRRSERDGFSSAPGDVLAFKYFRDAAECRREDEKQRCIDKGLDVAVTEGARRRLYDLSEDKSTTAVFDSNRMSITMLRLLREELGMRPIAVPGTLQGVYVGDIFDAPMASQYGVFGTFHTNTGDGGVKWVALPAWTQLLQAEEPVALEIPDCSQIPLLVTSSFVASDDDLKRLATPGMLVLERRVRRGDYQEDAYYAVPANEEGYGVALVEGRVLLGQDVDVCGRVLFCARPPPKEASMSEEDMGVLQL